MVHALHEIWRVLVTNGRLIDLRPRATNWPLEVVADGQASLAGKVDNTPFVPDDNAAESAIQRTVLEGLFSREHQESFDCASYWDTLEGMCAYYAESDSPPLTVPDDVLATAHELIAATHQHGKVRIPYSMDLVEYRKLGPELNK